MGNMTRKPPTTRVGSSAGVASQPLALPIKADVMGLDAGNDGTTIPQWEAQSSLAWRVSDRHSRILQLSGSLRAFHGASDLVSGEPEERFLHEAC